MKNLIETEFVVREIPILEKPKSKKGRYYLRDNFLLFWFRYIHPNLSSIEEGIFNVDVIRNDYSSYTGYIFEKISRETVVHLIREKKLPEFTKIGKQWGKIPSRKETYEIDVVALNDQTKDILFAECKWKDKVNAEKVCKELVEKASYVEWNNNKRKEYLAVFAKSFSKKIDEFEGRKVFCFDLKDVEKMMKRKK